MYSKLFIKRGPSSTLIKVNPLFISNLKKYNFLKPFCALFVLSFFISNFVISQTSTFSATGAVQTFTAPTTGCYTIQVWGAKGGNDASSVGGNGGYATGQYNLSAGQVINVYVGGLGLNNSTNSGGGWNGGGNAGSAGASGGGGGASDVRVGGTANSNRIIVAGGGGGAGNSTPGNTGGFGGGLTGGSSGGSAGTGGTQLAGGTGGPAGSLGQGANRATGGDGGGGGGGYYGGGAGNGDYGGGGGSSFIDGVANGSTIAGNASMPNPAGTGANVIGNNGAGRVIISLNTPIAIVNCPTNINICNTTTATWTNPTWTGCPPPAVIPSANYVGTYNGNYYYYVPGVVTWTTARANAVSRGGRLATIESAGENTFLTNYLTSNSIGSAWIGYTDEVSEGNFVSVTGIPLSYGNAPSTASNGVYNNWEVGEPNNAGVGENYTTIVNTGRWNDLGSAATVGYFIEFGLFQTSGFANGATNFPVGTTTINYSIFLPTNLTVTNTCSFTVTVGVPSGNINVFGNNSWNVYGLNNNGTYNSAVPLTGAYHGYYTQTLDNTNNFGFNTQLSWAASTSPSNVSAFNNATGVGTAWQGCVLPNDYYTFVHKRQGFPCASYQLTMNQWDDATQVYIDGVLRWSCTTWIGGSGACTGQTGTNTPTPIGVFELNANSTIEVRTAESTGDSQARLSITPINSGTLAINGQQKTCPVRGDQWVHFYNHPNGNYIASVRGTTPTSDLGLVTATAYVDGSVQLVPACNMPFYETAVLQRHWVITPTIDGNAVVRLPYTNAELTSLATASTTSSSPYDLVTTQPTVLLSKYSGGVFPASVNVDANPNNNCAVGGTTLHNYTAYGTTPVTGITSLYSDFTIPGFSEFWLHGMTNGSPLSVNLKSFSTFCGETDMTISWSTTQEQNSDYFILERSRDGISWEAIAKINGAGTSNTLNNYSYVDQKIEEVYYRLKQFDFDGSNEVFGPIYSKCKTQENALIVYPNPATGSFVVMLNSTNEMKESKIVVQDLNGKLIEKKDVNLSSGVNSVYFEGDNLAKGTYLISIQSENTKVFVPVKLIIQ